MSKTNDKPFWGPVGRLLGDFRMRFCGWPAAERHLQIPGRGALTILIPVGAVKCRPTRVREDRLICANDEVFNPSPEAA